MKKILPLFLTAIVAGTCCGSASISGAFASDAGAWLSVPSASEASSTATLKTLKTLNTGYSASDGSSNVPAATAPQPLRSIDETFDGRNERNARTAPQTSANDSANRPTDELAIKARAIAEGDRLMDAGRWLDAKKTFEKALRSYPDDPALRTRFASARRRQDVSVRYQDSAFVELTDGSNLDDLLAIFDETFLDVDNYHVDCPSRAELCELGFDGIADALADESFYVRRGLPAERRADALASFESLRETAGSWRIESETDARRVVLWVARQLRRSSGIPETATVAEFLCGVVCSLDAYSAYLTPIQVDDVFSMIDGRFVGLGVELKTDDPARVVRVIPNSPASECGVRAGDEIVSVDGQETAGLTGTEVGSLLQGEEGERAALVLRDATGRTRRVVAVRRQVDVPSVENVRILDVPGDVGYVKIACFQKTTATELAAAIDELSREHMRSLIVDLRQNPGGLLQEAIDVSDLFLDEGTIVKTRGRGGERTYSARSAAACSVPLVLLIDSNSASASEIFAGAMRENGRARVVGTQSFGKGTVQAILQLSCETKAAKPIAGLRLTTEKFYSPLGRAYSGVGVTPDVRVDETAETTAVSLAPANAPYAEAAPLETAAPTVRRAAKPLIAADGRAEFVDADDESSAANEIAADPILSTGVREANRLVAAKRAAATANQTPPSARTPRAASRFVGVSTGRL